MKLPINIFYLTINAFYYISSGASANLHHDQGFSLAELLGTVGSIIMLIFAFPVAFFVCLKIVQEYERAVIFRLGRLRRGGARGPGAFFILPCMDEYRCVDLRTRIYDVPPQEIMTKDSVSIAVDAVVFYRVFDPIIAVANVANFNESTRLLAATVLRNVLGTKKMSELLTDRVSIATSMRVNLDEATDPWGVKVERVEIKDVRLPVNLQRAMAQEAEATRDAAAKIIMADGEKMASRALKNASDVLVGSPGALQLRLLQTLMGVAADRNHTIIVPMPLETLRYFAK